MGCHAVSADGSTLVLAVPSQLAKDRIESIDKRPSTFVINTVPDDVTASWTVDGRPVPWVPLASGVLMRQIVRNAWTVGEAISGWAAEGVGTGRVLRLPGKLPGLYMIQTDAKGERRFFHWRDSAAARLASIVAGARTMRGASPGCAKRAARRSDCSTLEMSAWE